MPLIVPMRGNRVGRQRRTVNKTGDLTVKKTLIAFSVAAFGLSGCMTYDPYTGEQKTSSATKGSIIGAIGGAAVGAATSSSSDRGKGALIGAAGGAAVGGGIGYYMD